MSLTGSKTGGRAILRLTGRSEKEMENINMGGQISSADFGQFSLGVYKNKTIVVFEGENHCRRKIMYVDMI